MTTDPEPIPAPPAPTPDRLPDDHPAARALAKANKEAETLRLRLQDLEDKDKSELQKAKDALAERDAQLADLPKSIRSQVLRFASAAAAKGFLDPEDALVFIGEVDLSDAKSVETALDELATRKPHLVKTAPKQKLPSRPKPGGGDGESTEVDALKGKDRAAAALRQMRGN